MFLVFEIILGATRIKYFLIRIMETNIEIVNPLVILAPSVYAGVCYFICVSIWALYIRFIKKDYKDYKKLIYLFPIVTIIFTLPMGILATWICSLFGIYDNLQKTGTIIVQQVIAQFERSKNMSNEIIDNQEYKEIFENIKNEILISQYKAIQAVNKELIYMYWHIGKIILEKGKWGNKFIDNLSIDLKLEFPNVNGFSIRNLKNMRKFAEEYPDFKFVQSVTAQITQTHNALLLNKIKSVEIRKWYINETVKNGWSVNLLEMQINSKLYERQAVAEKVTNFENTLPDIQSDLAEQTMKDPYLFDFI